LSEITQSLKLEDVVLEGTVEDQELKQEADLAISRAFVNNSEEDMKKLLVLIFEKDLSIDYKVNYYCSISI